MRLQARIMFLLSMVSLLFLSFGSLHGQGIQAVASLKLDEPIPFDASTRTGTLANGMKYYIKRNSKPENYAEMRLALNAGSLLETPGQQGLAHFVEHMCFNGTKDFPKMTIVNYLESIGTKFGAHLNAYTSFDETVYMLRVPTDDPDKFETGMSILENWAHKVSMEGEEIDKERGVVIEEWRTRLGAGERMNRVVFPNIYYQSRYAERLPIGKVPVLENFPHDTLRAYYDTWYRPDLMAFVAVGDFDIDQVEHMIKEKFGQIPAKENPQERPIYDLPLHDKTIVTMAEDQEATSNQIGLMYKHPKMPNQTIGDFRRSIVERLASSMLNQRLDELTQSAEPPFSYSSAGYYGLMRTKDQYRAFAVVPEGTYLKGLESLLTESKRASIHGFTDSELDRTKKALLAGIEKRYNEREKTPSNRIIMRFVYHYLRNAPAPSIEQSYGLYQELVDGITLEEVNLRFQAFTQTNSRVVSITGVQKEGNELPTEEAVRALIEQVDEMEVTPYEDKEAEGPLIENLPQPGEIVASKDLDAVGATELTLSNGVKVVLKPTTFQDDEIRLQSFSPGGTSVMGKDNAINAQFATSIITSSGLGPFDNIQLEKYLSDKVVSVSPYLGELYQGINANCSPKDLETMMQLIHLYFVAPRKDEVAFKSLINKNKTLFANLTSNPDYWFINEMLKFLYKGDVRRTFIPPADIWDKIELDEVYTLYKQAFADAGDFHFTLVGNFEVEAIKPLLTQYLGSLPTSEVHGSWVDPQVPKVTGKVEKIFNKGSEPKSQARIMFSDEYTWDPKTNFELGAAVDVARIMLREVLREDKGGVYGVGIRLNTARDPKNTYTITINFTCSPENSQDLRDATFATIKKLQKEGPSEENMQKVKETRRKDLEVNQKENRFWINYLESTYQQGLSLDRIETAEARIDQLSAKRVKAAAKKYFNFDELAIFVLMPETETVDR